jgi:hypothetical protein
MYIDEIIRQITIKNPEHGNVMIRIRDDLKMSIDGYRKLQESMIAKDIRKLLLVIIDKDINAI